MSDLDEKVKKSIERLKAFEPPEGYYLAFSGGKDSVVCKALLDMSGCKYDATYRVTSVDPPELVRFIKTQHPDVKRDVPRYADDYKNPKLAGKPITMWNLISEKNLLPTRWMRYCCASLKESGGDGRIVVTGVRWAESPNRRDNQGIVTVMGERAGSELGDNKDFRKTNRGGVVLTNDNEDSRRMVEQCYKRHKTTVNPIINWEGEDVWQFIKGNKIPYCSLYDEGLRRLGCIGCPLNTAKNREWEFARWPKYKDSYIRAIQKMLDYRQQIGKPFRMRTEYEGATVQDVFNWWMGYDVLPGQLTFDDYEEELDAQL